MKSIVQKILIICILTYSLHIPSLFAQNDTLLRNQLIEAIGSFEEGNFELSLTQLNQLLQDATEEKNHKIITHTKLNVGILYFIINENEKALNYYFEALEYAKKHELEHLYNSIYNNIGIIYSKNHENEKAKEYFSEALTISRKLNDKNKVGINLVNLANLKSDQSNFTTSKKYLEEAENIFSTLKDTQRIAAIQSTYGQIFFDQEKYILAKKHQLLAYNMQTNFDDPYYLSGYSINLAATYNQLSKYDSALYYANHCLKLSFDMKDKESIIKSHKLIGNLYEQKEQYQLSTEHLNESLIWSDSLMIEKSQKWISEMQMKYEFTKKIQEIDFLERKNKLFRIIWFMSFLIFIIVIIFMFYSYRSRNIKIKQKNALLESENKLDQLELQKSDAENKCLLEEMKANEEVNRIKQEQLRESIDHKNRELASNALHVINKNTILSDIQSMITTIECANETATKTKIKSINQLIKANINLDSDWDVFKLHFEEVHGDFFDRIQSDYPSLTQGDLRLCAYLLINLNPKEIAQILNITPDSIRKRKQRLREKLNLDKEMDVLDILNKYKVKPSHI